MNTSRERLLWIGTAVMLGIGYVLLGRGETTMSPVFLLAGYMVLAPMAILSNGTSRKTS